MDYGKFYKYLHILINENILNSDYKKNIYHLSYEAQKIIREQKLNERLKELYDELDKFCIIEPSLGTELKNQIKEANEHYQQIAQACREYDQAVKIESSSEDVFQENSAMSVIWHNTQKLVKQYKAMSVVWCHFKKLSEQSEEIEKKAILLSQQIGKEKKFDKNREIRENNLNQLRKVLQLIKIISNCSIFCTINKTINNHTLYLGLPFDGLSKFFIGYISRCLLTRKKLPSSLVFKNLEQYEKYKKDFATLVQKLESIDPKDSSTFLKNDLNSALTNFEYFVKGGYLYKTYEKVFGPSSNDRYLTQNECEKLKTIFKSREEFSSIIIYQALWVYERLLNEPPKYYHQLNDLEDENKLILETHGSYGGILSDESSNHLTPSETAKQLKEYNLSKKCIYLEFPGCLLGESIDNNNIGVKLLAEALSEQGYDIVCTAFKQIGLTTQRYTQSFRARVKRSRFGRIHTNQSIHQVIAYMDPFINEARILMI